MIKAHSDALVILTLDPKQDAIQSVSIPRDTSTMIVGKVIEDKINYSYAFGGADMTVATVENLLDVEMDYYVNINMGWIKSLLTSWAVSQ